ncbi:MAG: hypothetical protein PHV17_06825 [Candidatus Omnitrophica bacterium]|nr:hypothetical protein [Candidatus Omnitrophota bacterium]
MIPRNITRANILKALKELDRGVIPKIRISKKFLLVYKNKQYPPKYVISLSNRYANGKELDCSLFNGGDETNSYLEAKGFKVISVQASNIFPGVCDAPRNTKAQKRHSERCCDCKKVIIEMLRKIYGEVEINPKINISAKAEDYKSRNKDIFSIYNALKAYRGSANFDRRKTLPRCDILVKNGNFLVELDESQHFTKLREITLSKYPKTLRISYDFEKWKQLCEEIKAKDSDPCDRDEARAWYDVLRDFLSVIDPSFGPTIRIYLGSTKWCDLDPNNQDDIDCFKKLVKKKHNNEYSCTKIKNGDDPKLARIILKGPWKGDRELAKNVLESVAGAFSKKECVDFLITCGAFLTFDLPEGLIGSKDINIFIKAAEKECKQLLSKKLRDKLSKFVKYITIGVDYRSINGLQSLYCEMVAIVELKTNKYYWTGKSYPTTTQETTLIRFQDLKSHFISTSEGKVMVLGCHDLNIFSKRGKSVTQKEWKKKIRKDFYKIAKKMEPEIVLHHPHTTDYKATWTSSWKEIVRTIPTVKKYVGAGLYYNPKPNEEVTSTLEDVLDGNRRGSTLDFVFDSG